MEHMDKEHLDIILQNDAVKKAIAKSGEDAMKNPEVQAKMLEVAKEKFPDMAHSAQSKIIEWAEDPECHEKAKKAGLWALEEAKELAELTAHKAYDLIKQGPAGVRVLAFICSLLAFIFALIDVIKVWNILPKVGNGPAAYVGDCWQVFFAFSSCLFEANPEHVEKVKMLDKWHDLLIEYAKFLCFPAGRACFYFFQSSLWISEVFENEHGFMGIFKGIGLAATFAIGLFLFVIGAFNLGMHYGIMPITGLNKTKKMAAPAMEAATGGARRTIAFVQESIADFSSRGSKASLRESLNKGTGSEIELGGPPAFKGAQGHD